MFFVRQTIQHSHLAQDCRVVDVCKHSKLSARHINTHVESFSPPQQARKHNRSVIRTPPYAHTAVTNKCTLNSTHTRTHAHTRSRSHQSVTYIVAAPCHLLHNGITVALSLLWSHSKSIQQCHKAIPNTFPKHILRRHKVLHPSQGE